MRRGPFLILFAVSGAAALIYEVVWTRLLTLHMGHGLAAASAVLAAFMGGLAAGAGAAGRYAGTLPPRRALDALRRRSKSRSAALARADAVRVDRGPAAARRRPTRTAMAAARSRSSGWRPACCCSACRRRAWARRFRSRRDGSCAPPSTAAQDAGGLYAANTLGAAAGAVLAGFALIPALGLRGTTFVGVALNLIAAGGAWLIVRVRPLN